MIIILTAGGFQSIGVTKEWRLTSLNNDDAHPVWFPINRRHQRMATVSTVLNLFQGSQEAGFQSIGVTKEWRLVGHENCTPRFTKLFPINRRHQRMATCSIRRAPLPRDRCFQSIGVTKEWRLRKGHLIGIIGGLSFQSIGVTKEWRPEPGQTGGRSDRSRVSNQ